MMVGREHRITLCICRTFNLSGRPVASLKASKTLKLALAAFDASDFVHAMSFVNEWLKQGVSWNAGKAEALNMRGTFKYAPFYFSLKLEY